MRALAFLWHLYGGVITYLLALPVWAWQRLWWRLKPPPKPKPRTKTATDVLDAYRYQQEQQVMAAAMRRQAFDRHRQEVFVEYVLSLLQHRYPLPEGWTLTLNAHQDVLRDQFETVLHLTKGEHKHAIRGQPVSMDSAYKCFRRPEDLADHLDAAMASLQRFAKRRDEMDRLKD